MASQVNNGMKKKSASFFAPSNSSPSFHLFVSLCFSISIPLMAFQLRKLLSDSNGYCTSTYCAYDDSGDCLTPCLPACPNGCYLLISPESSLPPPPPPPPPPHPAQILDKSYKFSLTIIYVVPILSFFFVLTLLFAFYRRYRSRRFASPPRSPSPPPDRNDDFIDEEEGPILDHPIWYIRTVGLQPSVISAITICKYKRGDGLIEGTDCSVCLTEFEEDENLRLLPKCNHAFHIPCIDTWLRSHTNCPLCRAPVAAAALPPQPGPVISGQEEEVQPDNPQNIGDSSNREDEDELAVVEDEIKRLGESSSAGEGAIQAVRRSVSLDSLSAFQISSALSHAFEAPKSGSDHLELAKIGSNQKGKTKVLLSLVSASTSGKSVSSEFMKRSLSCTSKFFQRTSSTQRKNGVIPR